MDNQLPSLRLLRGDRRGSARAGANREESICLHGRIGSHSLTGAQILSMELGRVILKVPFDGQILHAADEKLVVVELRDHETLFMTGQWTIVGSRNDGGAQIIALEHPDLQTLKPLEDSLDITVLHRSDRLRVLRTASESDREELERHFTDMVAFPTAIPCVVRVADLQYKGQFNFEARSRVLQELHMQFDQLPPLATGDKVRFEYSFFTVRYVAIAEIAEVDQDFGLLVLKFPDWIAALTARRYDRRDCDLDVLVPVGESSEPVTAKMFTFSIAGGTLHLPEVCTLVPGSELAVSFPVPGVKVDIVVRSCRQNVVGFSFRYPDEQCDFIRKIFCATVRTPFVVRDESNIAPFEKLYRKVGYGPKEPVSENAWLEKTLQSWIYQDRSLPGNMIGAMGRDDLSMALGILPMGEKVANGHSLAMDRSIDSIKRFFEVSAMNLAFTSLLESVTHFIATAKTKSRFSTRIHTCFECHAKAQTHDVLYALSLTGSPDLPQNYDNPYHIQSNLEGSWVLPDVVRHVVGLMKKAHPSMAEAHEIRHFQITDRVSGKLMAWVVGHSTPDYFTAVNMFQIAMCFLVDEAADINHVYQAILSDEFLRPLGMEFFANDLKKIPPAPQTARPQDDVFWWIFDKEEMGPVMASLSRSAWAVMKKYGGDFDETITRFVA